QRGGARSGSERADWVCVSVVRAAAEADGAEERRVAADLFAGVVAWPAEAGEGGAGKGGGARQDASSAESTLRRAGAAGGERAGAGGQTVDPPGGRADRKPGQRDQRGDPGAVRSALRPGADPPRRAARVC